MDQDPELDVTLSDGRRVATFQIAAVAEARETWAVVEPGASPRVIRGNGAALAARQRLDARIAARLAAGWVPVDRRSAGAPRVPPAPLAPDLVLLISSLLEALARARSALQAADPSGQLWAACCVFRQQAWRFGVSAPDARVQRARQERRLGELAEQAGDRAAAILHDRLALASYARVGVKRRLLRLHAAATAPEAPPVRPAAAAGREPARQPAPRGFATASRACTTPAHSTRLWAATERSCVGGHPARPHTRRKTMKGRVQIVGRLPVELSRRVRGAAQRRKVSVNAFLIEALTQALGTRRVAEKEPR